MILPDANILLYAYNSTCAQHLRAKPYLENLLSSNEEVGFTWAVLLAFLRISTNPKAFPKPLTIVEARSIVSAWLGQPNARILQPGSNHWQVLDSLLAEVGVAGNLTTDAHLAALAMEHDAVLVSCDRDFGQFTTKGLVWVDPLDVRIEETPKETPTV